MSATAQIRLPSDSLGRYLTTAKALLDQIDAACVRAACDALEAAFRGDAAVFACGNGGSATNASHFTEDLAKLMWHEPSGRRLRCHCLADPTAFVMALANDDGYERIFEIQLAIQSSPGDLLFCISGSGNSANVVRAARWAREHDCAVVGVTGYDGGELRHLATTHLHVPSCNMGMLECVHMLLLDYMSKETRWRAYGVAHDAR